MSRNSFVDFLTAERKLSPAGAFTLLIVAGFIAGSLNLVAPTSNQQALMAQAAASTPEPGSGSVPAAPAPQAYEAKGPKDCEAAINLALNKTKDPQVANVDAGQSGTLDGCFGAVLKPGKTPSAKKEDYQCVGRTGVVSLGEKATAVTYPDSERKLAPGKCSIQICSSLTSATTNAGVAWTGTGCQNPKLIDGLSPIGSVASMPNAPSISSPASVPPLTPGAGEQAPVPNASAVPSSSACGSDAACAEAARRAAEPAPAGCGSDAACAEAARRNEEQSRPPVLPEGEKQELPVAPNCPNGASGQCTVSAVPPDQAQRLVDTQGYTCGEPNSDGNVNCVKPANAGARDNNGPAQRAPNNGNTFSGPGGAGSNGSAPSGGAGSGLMSGLSSFLGGMMKGLVQSGGLASLLGGATAPTCPSDAAGMQQYQQQYNYQLQQYNYQLQQYNYQQQMSAYYGGNMNGYYGTGFGVPTGYTTGSPPQPPVPCKPGTSNTSGTSGTTGTGGGSGVGQCPQLQAQPNPSACPLGDWRQMTTTGTNGYVCPVWQCVPNNSLTPTAQLSCQPATAEVGTQIAISYTCGNATSATGYGFTTNGATSGSTSTVVANPPAGATAMNFSLRCENQNTTASAQCSVQLSKLSIVLRASPTAVPPGGSATIGWVTSGMDSCVVSSPDQADFTSRNSGITSVNGVASTSRLTRTSVFNLRCISLNGSIKEASTTVYVVRPGTISSTLVGRTDVQLGNITQIQWSFPDAPAVSAVSLWLIDTVEKRVVALITGQRAKAGSYSWTLPTLGEGCDPSSSLVCPSDLIAGRSYALRAALYTPPNAGLGENASPNLPQAQYIDVADTAPFKMNP